MNVLTCRDTGVYGIYSKGCYCLVKKDAPLLCDEWNTMTVIADAATASKEDVLELYANKWRDSIAQSCASLAQVLQVPDAVALHRVIAGAWPFADQVSLAFTLWDTSVLAICRLRCISW